MNESRVAGSPALAVWQRLRGARRLLRKKYRALYSACKARTSGAESFGVKPWIARKVIFTIWGKAVFGDRLVLDGSIAPIFIKVFVGAIFTVGHDVAMNCGVWIEAWHEVHIGNHVMLAPYVSILDDNLHETEPGSVQYKGPIIIGDNVWLGRNVAVMPGVCIGEGSVVAANSVVTRDIPPKSFAAGAPARVIRQLNLPDGWLRHDIDVEKSL
jgi:acetyltransferase-like isoleucine patch superfamily enzyme